MANESFSDALHRLKEIHDKEVLGMQSKLTELTMERCRDTQRLEELFSKNHLLREQHKVLNENIKVLENRLRAGLCDRCTVTQELAKKKHQEYENCHFHNLQQISSLTKQIKCLKEENKSLLEELRKFRCLDEKNRPRSHSPECNDTSDAHLSEFPAANVTNSPEQNGTQTSEDIEDRANVSDHNASEETSPTVLQLSPPVLKHVHLKTNDSRQADLTMSGGQKVLLTSHKQQRISNQLHGTIAVMRPGAKCGQHVTSSPIRKNSSDNDVTPNEGQTNFPEAPSPLDSLKHVIHEEHLHFLKQHFIQKHRAQYSPGIPSDGPFRYLLGNNRELTSERKRSDEDWDEKAAMAELQGAMLYMREQGYKNRINLTNQREKIQYVNAKQTQGIRPPSSPGDVPKYRMRESPVERELSLLQVLSTHWKNRRLGNQEEEKDCSDKEESCAMAEKIGHLEEDATPDKPLDLSDTRRGHHSAQNDIKRDPKGHYDTRHTNLASGSDNSPANKASGSDQIHGVHTENSMSLAKSEHGRDTEEGSLEGAMEHNVRMEMTRDLIIKRHGKGNKRHWESESDEEEEGKATGVNSPHPVIDDDLGTSDSDGIEGEMERSQQSKAETSRDSYVSERNHSQWKKKLSQASKKCLRKKKKVHDHPAESDLTQNDSASSVDLEQERAA